MKFMVGGAAQLGISSIGIALNVHRFVPTTYFLNHTFKMFDRGGNGKLRDIDDFKNNYLTQWRIVNRQICWAN